MVTTGLSHMQYSEIHQYTPIHGCSKHWISTRLSNLYHCSPTVYHSFQWKIQTIHINSKSPPQLLRLTARTLHLVQMLHLLPFLKCPTPTHSMISMSILISCLYILLVQFQVIRLPQPASLEAHYLWLELHLLLVLFEGAGPYPTYSILFHSLPHFFKIHAPNWWAFLLQAESHFSDAEGYVHPTLFLWRLSAHLSWLQSLS